MLPWKGRLMASPSTVDEFLDLVRKSGVLEDKRLDAYLDKLRTAGALPGDVQQLANQLRRRQDVAD